MDRRGYTFVELMTAIILLGVVTAIAIPRLRNGLEKQNVRSARGAISTMVAITRSAAVQRGCNATLNLTTDSAWVTACPVTGAGVVAIGTKKFVGSQFGVRLSFTSAAISWDPRGIQTQFQRNTIRVIGTTRSDSVIVNEVGKVVRQ